MSEREDLLNNLKIDRSQAPISDQPVYRKSILLGGCSYRPCIFLDISF